MTRGPPTSEGGPFARIAAEVGRAGSRAELATWFGAPGRVNLVGDHTDYSGGFVLPLAIDRWCAIAARAGPTVRVRSLDAHALVEMPADGSADPEAVEPPWGRYVAGVVRQLAELGRPPVGIDAVVASDVPLGSGLSSSAALEVACALALADEADWECELVTLAEACRAAEEAATGVPCGIMDQLASLAGRAGSVLLIDCRSLEHRPIPLPPQLGILVVHSGVSRSLAASPYRDRRRACEELARELGVPALRDATAAQVETHPLGRHVVSENARVLEAVGALADGDLARLGLILNASHASLAGDYRVSTPELDQLVVALVEAGAYGARLTGAGFGGCAVAVCDAEAVDAVATVASVAYRDRTGLEPAAFACRPVDGAARVVWPGKLE